MSPNYHGRPDANAIDSTQHHLARSTVHSPVLQRYSHTQSFPIDISCSSLILQLVCCRVSCLVLARTFWCLCTCSPQLLAQRRFCPHPDFLCLCLLFSCAVYGFRFPKFSAAFRFIYRSQSCLQHFQSHVFPKQPSPYVDLRHDSVVLVASVDVCANSAVVYQVDKPFLGLFGVWLLFSSPVCKLRRINTGDSNVKLALVSNQRRRTGGYAQNSKPPW